MLSGTVSMVMQGLRFGSNCCNDLSETMFYGFLFIAISVTALEDKCFLLVVNL